MEKLQPILDYVKARVAEPSTWAGIAAAATAVSIALGQHQGLWGAVVAAALAILMREKK